MSDAFKGGCPCRAVRYRMTSRPLFVHGCHAGAGDLAKFVRVGTLDMPDAFPPDIHIFTASKQPWVVLPPGTPAMPDHYDFREHWPRESQERREAMRRRAGLPS